jgi:hypothetical protein
MAKKAVKMTVNQEREVDEAIGAFVSHFSRQSELSSLDLQSFGRRNWSYISVGDWI